MTLRLVGVVALAWAWTLGPGPARAEKLAGGVLGTGPTPAAGIAGGGLALRGTVGQAVVGTSADRTRILNHGFWCFGGSRVVAVIEPPEPDRPLPRALALGPAVPNPTRGETSFALGLPRGARVRLAAFDVQGRLVETIVDRDLDAGLQTIHWRAPGEGQLYFVRLVVDGVRVGERRIVVRR